MIKLVIADNSELVQIGLTAIFSDCDNVEVISAVASDDDLQAVLKQGEATVVLMDFTADGFSVDSIVETKRSDCCPAVLAITPAKNGLTIVSALKAGVSGYVKKDCSKQEIIDAVKATGNGDQFFCGQILQTLQDENIDPKDQEHVDFTCAPVNISERELEIITLIAEGFTNSQIADKLFISGHTVNTHRRNIMQKLGVKNTAAVVLYAVKMGLISPNRFLFSPEPVV